MDLTPPSSRSGMTYTSPNSPSLPSVGGFVISEARRLSRVYTFFRNEPAHGPLGHGRLDLDADVRSSYRRISSLYTNRYGNQVVGVHPSLNKVDSAIIWLKRPYRL